MKLHYAECRLAEYRGTIELNVTRKENIKLCSHLCHSTECQDAHLYGHGLVKIISLTQHINKDKTILLIYVKCW